MSANVALSDTFDTWRTRTNTLLTYTQGDGGTEALKIANTTDSSSKTTGSLISTGGAGFAKTVYVGENFNAEGNSTFSKDVTVTGNTTIGSNSSDVVTINGTLSSSIVPTVDVTSATLGSATKRFAALYVNGVVGDTATGSLQIPAGTTAQRAGETGAIRWNSTLSRFEGNTGTNFVSLAVGSQDQDGDTKITLENSSDEDFIRFFTGNSSTQSTERLNIAIGGNVAIGTGATAADAKLQVTGTANVSGTVTLGNQLLATGNVKATGHYANLTTTQFVTIDSPLTTIDSDNTIITGNLVVQGTRTFVDTQTITSRDKTMVLGAGSQTFSNSSFTAASPTVITSKVNNSTTAHGLTNGDKIVVLRSSDTTNIPIEAVYTVTVISSTTFSIPQDLSAASAGTLDFAGPQTDAGIDDAGIIIPGTTVHKLTWDDGDNSWNFTDPLDVSGDIVTSGNIKLGGNIIKASDGGSTITLDTSDNVTIGNDITIGGNVIRASDGGATITMDTSDNVTVGAKLTATALKATTGAGANKILKSDGNGDLSYVDFGVFNSSGTRLGP